MSQRIKTLANAVRGAGWGLGASLLLSACIHTPEVRPPAPLAVPAAFGAATASSAPLPERWWKTFDDPHLTELVERALSDNFQLKTAWARLRQADALAVQARSGLFPTVGLEGSVGANRSGPRVFPDFTGGGGTTTIDPIESESYGLSVAVAYEVDLWGKAWSRKRAGDFDLTASRDELEAAAMTLVAQVTEAYFSSIAQRAQVALLEEQLEVNRTLLELIELRFAQGLSVSLDVYQQRQQVAASEAQLAAARAERDVLAQQLAVLVGVPPQERVGGERAVLPELPPLPGTGVPGDLLVRRPDLRAAQNRVVAADYRVGVALAELLPTLRLSGSVGFSAPSLELFFADVVYNLLAGLTQPVFEGGRRLAEVDRSEAALTETVYGFGDTLLTALLEVESALLRERQQRERLEHIRAQRENARAALREARARYTSGLTDFLRVLTALQAQQLVDQALLREERKLLSHRVQLCRALGGTWTTELASEDGETS